MEERDDVMATIFIKQALLPAIAGILLLNLFSTTASAQVEYKSEGEVKVETKKGVRKSKKYKAPAYYKESHLNTNIYQYKKGQSGKKVRKGRDERDKYQFDYAGRPYTRDEAVEPPKIFGIFKRKNR